jgi:hypothetical protein
MVSAGRILRSRGGGAWSSRVAEARATEARLTARSETRLRAMTVVRRLPKQPPVPALVPGLAARSAPASRLLRARRRRGRILRGRQRRVPRAPVEPRRSSSATRLSSRWFASASSPSRINSATAVSRSPSRNASASARSTPRSSTHSRGSLQRAPGAERNDGR